MAIAQATDEAVDTFAVRTLEWQRDYLIEQLEGHRAELEKMQARLAPKIAECEAQLAGIDAGLIKLRGRGIDAGPIKPRG